MSFKFKTSLSDFFVKLVNKLGKKILIKENLWKNQKGLDS